MRRCASSAGSSSHLFPAPGSRLWPLCQFLEAQSYSAAVKAACALVGDATGPVRAPLLPLDEAATRQLATLVEHATLAEAPAG